MNIIQSILTKNPCYTAGRKITVKGLMLHSIGCAQPDATVFTKRWNSTDYDSACVHAFIDGNTGDVYQCLPWNHRGWHCGASGNNTHIGVEMCEPASLKYGSGASFTCSDTAAAKACVQRTYDAAVQLFAHLCKTYGLDPLGSGVIVSHAEGYKLGIASGHSDPEHLWNGLKMGYTMDTFRKAVKAAMSGTTTATATTTKPAQITTSSVWYRVRKAWNDAGSQIGAFRDLANAKECAAAHPGYSVYDGSGNVVYAATGTSTFRVRVTVDDLNIRKGAGTNYKVVGTAAPNVYTITEVKTGQGSDAGWGRLKSGAGWISLDYVTRV